VGVTLLFLSQVKNEAAVLGFVGAPFTLASYCVEGGSSKNFTMIKKLAFSEPTVLRTTLFHMIMFLWSCENCSCM
jgi:uroporphyrinogen decarboxylase